MDLTTRTRQDQHGVIIGNSPAENRLEYIVDHAFRRAGYRTDVDASYQLSRPGIQVRMVLEVLDYGLLQAGGRWHQQDGMEMQAAIARGLLLRGGGLSNRKVDHRDHDGKLVGWDGPGLAMRPSHKGRVNSLDLISHLADDGCTWTAEMIKYEGHEICRPPIFHSVGYQPRVPADHQLQGSASRETLLEWDGGLMNGLDRIDVSFKLRLMVGMFELGL